MEIIDIIKLFTPGFFGSIFGGIYIATILMQKPMQFNILSITTLILLCWLFVLYILGVTGTWIVLSGFKTKKTL